MSISENLVGDPAIAEALKPPVEAVTVAQTPLSDKNGYRFQTYGVDAEGNLVHCGPRRCRQYGQATAQRDHEIWEAETATMAQYCPDCPRSQRWLAGERVVAIIVHPIGEPDKRRRFPVKSRQV